MHLEMRVVKKKSDHKRLGVWRNPRLCLAGAAYVSCALASELVRIFVARPTQLSSASSGTKVQIDLAGVATTAGRLSSQEISRDRSIWWVTASTLRVSSINAEEEPIFTPLPFLHWEVRLTRHRWALGCGLTPVPAPPMALINYPSLYFGVLTCESYSGPASYFVFTGPDVPLGFPVFTAV